MQIVPLQDGSVDGNCHSGSFVLRFNTSPSARSLATASFVFFAFSGSLSAYEKLMPTLP